MEFYFSPLQELIFMEQKACGAVKDRENSQGVRCYYLVELGAVLQEQGRLL